MTKTKDEKDTIYKQVKQGRFVPTLQWFGKHWVVTSLLLVISVIYISAKYSCQLMKADIIDLKSDLNNAKTDCVKFSAEYKSLIREARMKARIDSAHLDLEQSDQPPFKLTGK